MKIKILGSGTSNGVPVIGCNCKVCSSMNSKDKRLRSSCYIENGKDSILIDCGPDFRQQALQTNINPMSAILLTHSHRDHIAGLDDARLWGYYRKGAIDIYCDKLTLEDLKKVYFYYFLERKYPGVINWNIVLHNYRSFRVGETLVNPIRVLHGKVEISGYRINGFAWLTDMKSLPESEFEKLKDLEVVAIDCLREKDHHSHMTTTEAIDMAKRIDAKKTILIHMNHEFGLHDEVQKSLPENIIVGYDGMEIEL